MSKIEQLKNNFEKGEVFIDYEKNCFVNSEYDIEVSVDTGEYYHGEQEGILNLILFFNINVAYNHAGMSKVGLQVRINLTDIEEVIKKLKNLLQSSPQNQS